MASESSSDLISVIEICQQLGTDEEVVGNKLVELGWTPSEDPQTIGDLLFWTNFARDFAVYTDQGLEAVSDSEKLGEQLGYFIVNAGFMAASMLGNSALPEGQPSYENNSQRLAVLGVSLGKGQCVLSGPDDVAQQILSLEGFEAKWPENLPRSNRAGVLAAFGKTEMGEVSVFQLDRTEITKLYGSETITLPYSRREFDPQIFDSMPEAVVAISPKQPE